MYTKLGFLPKKIQIEKLKNETLEEQYSEDSSEYDDDQIYESDMLIYAVKNTEELSYVEFHVRSVENDFFTHHDIFLTDTITASEYLKLGDTHYIAVAGYEKNVNLYDCFVYNPLDPQIQLKGHAETVNCLFKIDENTLQSGGDDKQIITWDLAQQLEKSKETKDYKIVKIEKCDNSVVLMDSSKIYVDDQVFFDNNYEIEFAKAINNTLYISDEKGVLKQFDIRKNGCVMQRKIHDDAITGFNIVKDEIVTVSTDELIIHSSLSTFEQRKVINSKNKLFCIAYDAEYSACICGGQKDELKFIDV